MNTITCPNCLARTMVELTEKPGRIESLWLIEDSPLQINIEITQDAEGVFCANANSSAGRKVIVDIVNDSYRNRDIRADHRLSGEDASRSRP